MVLSVRISLALRDMRLGGSGAVAEALENRYDEIFIPASEMVPDLTEVPTAGTRQQTTLQAAHYDYLAFDDGTVRTRPAAYFSLAIPQDMSLAANASFRFFWEAAAVVGSARWNLTAKPLADTENIDITFGSGSTGQDTATGTTRYLARFGSTIGPGVINPGELWIYRISRDSDNVGDTLIGDANLIGVGIQYYKLGANNAQWS